jgi:ATP synthase protein I
LPIMLAIFSLVGFAAGVRTMLGTARQIETQAKAEAMAKAEKREGN